MRAPLIIGLFIAAVIIPATISNWGLTESSEARYAEISRTMYTTGDYIQPKLLGIHHYHKPPVTYYLTSLGYSIFGVNEYGARFFLHIALLFQLLLVYKIAQLLYHDRSVSVTATLIYFSYPIVQIAAENLTTDAYLTTFIFSSIYFFLKYRQSRDFRTGPAEGGVKYLYLFYIFSGLSFLTKGPVGILPQILFAIVYIKTFNIKRKFDIHSLLALLLCIAICSSWFILLFNQNEKLLNYFLKYQLVDRVATDTFNRSKPFWYYLVFIPLLGLPAFCYFGDYLRTNVRSLNFKRNISCSLLITLSILFIIFSASSSKLILYVLPLYLFIAILSAKHLSTFTAKKVTFFENISLGFNCLLFLSLITACFLPLPLMLPKATVIVLSLIGITGLVFFSKVIFKVNYQKAPFLNAFSMVMLTFLLPFIMKTNDLQINSLKSVAAFIKEQSGGKKAGSIAVYDYLLPSLAFYTDENIITLNNGNTIAQRETQFEKTETRWQNSYFKLSENKDSVILSALLSKPNSYIVAQKKNPLPDSLSYLKKNLAHQILMGKWIIYF